MTKRRVQGITLVELLMALAIGGILLGLLGSYFSQQTRTSERVQARHDVANKVRAVGEIVAQDFQIAGSQAIMYGGARYINLLDASCSSQERSGCVSTHYDPVQNRSTTKILYATSLEPAEPCRSVSYVMAHDTGTLFRSDEPCETASGANLGEQVLADGISDFEITYRCAALPGAVAALQFDVPVACYDNGTVVVEAIIRITGMVAVRGDEFISTFETSALTPNLRRFDLY